LAAARPGDWLLTQNETNLQVEAARAARARGLRVAYAAAPFAAEAVRAVLPHLDFLILNEVEADQLLHATRRPPGELGVADVIVTLGAQGCLWLRDGRETAFPALPVTPVDTTGAGDAFTGYVLAVLDEGMPMSEAIRLATRAAALQVTRPGAADAIPTRAEAEAFQGDPSS
jgi:ribokinase